MSGINQDKNKKVFIVLTVVSSLAFFILWLFLFKANLNNLRRPSLKNKLEIESLKEELKEIKNDYLNISR